LAKQEKIASNNWANQLSKNSDLANHDSERSKIANLAYQLTIMISGVHKAFVSFLPLRARRKGHASSSV
jgi:hypothetical protein